jgi:hypothetical protein
VRNDLNQEASAVGADHNGKTGAGQPESRLALGAVNQVEENQGLFRRVNVTKLFCERVQVDSWG